MWHLVLRGFAELGKAFLCVIGGTGVLIVVGVTLDKLGYRGLVFRWMWETIVLGVLGPTTSNQQMLALLQSGWEKFVERVFGIVGMVAIIFLLWAVGDMLRVVGEVWWGVTSKELVRRRWIRDKRLWLVVLVCLMVVGFEYDRWLHQIVQTHFLPY